MPRALAPEIFTWPAADPQLIGSKCAACGAVAFPCQPCCPKCSGTNTDEVLLPRGGTVIAWTTQGFPPGAPYAGPRGDDFEPFGVGLVQLGNVIRVEGRLTVNDPAKLQFGVEVELTTVPLRVTEVGTGGYLERATVHIGDDGPSLIARLEGRNDNAPYGFQPCRALRY